MSRFPSASLTRRLASLMYDGLVVIAFSMLSTVLYLLLVQGFISMGFLSLGEFEDVSALIQETPLLYTLRTILLILVGILFYSYFWVKSGQTIGMRAWRLRVQKSDEQLLSWPQAIARSSLSLFGLGNLFILIDWKKKRSLQDWICKTEMVVLSKDENKRVYDSLD